MKNLLFIFATLSAFLLGQSATVQTIARAGGASTADVPNGWYNIVAGQNDGWSFTVSGFTAGGSYRLKANMDDGGTWNNVGSVENNPGTAFTFTIDQNTLNMQFNFIVTDYGINMGDTGSDGYPDDFGSAPFSGTFTITQSPQQ